MSKPEPWVIVAANQVNVAFAEGRIKTVNDTAEIIRDVFLYREKYARITESLDKE